MALHGQEVIVQMDHSKFNTSIAMHKSRAIIFISICMGCVVSSIAHADDGKFGIVSVLGGQDRTCLRWIENRKAGGGAADDDATWLFGFFSGYNAFAPGPHGFFFYYDEPNLLDVIDRICAEDPSDSIADAAVRFLNRRKQANSE